MEKKNDEIRGALQEALAEQARYVAERPKIEAEGEAALRRLFDIAHGHSGRCKIIAKFLLGCYNGDRFRFDLTDFRCLDTKQFKDCIAVLKMDAQPKREVHTFFPNGGKRFEELAKSWRITDHHLMRLELKKCQERYPPGSRAAAPDDDITLC